MCATFASSRSKMNNELKYVVHGCLLVIVFLIAGFVVKFCFTYERESQNSLSNPIAHNDSAANVSTSKGRTLFMTNCSSCHAINKRLTGPALAGINERVTDKKLLHDWIRNNKKVLQSGNDYFNTLYKEYGQVSMNVFPNLSDDDIDAILAYID